MNATSVLPAIIAVVVALLTTAALRRFLPVSEDQQRYSAIDGLRGYLAFFVFLHHACIWYFYLQTGEWRPPPSALYTHFGQSSVAMFFMITGFLFFSKLIDGRKVPIDWLRLFVSRILRLTPAYFLALSLMFGIVFLESDALNVSPFKLLTDALRWMSFTIFAAPDLNGFPDTWRITAGVTWSLPYEWFFYMSLPLLAIIMRAAVPLKYLALSAISVVVILWVWQPLLQHFLSFLTGIIAAFCVRSLRVRVLASTYGAAFLVLAGLTIMVNYLPTGNAYFKAIPLALAFVVIAGGNGLFGLLTNRLSRMLGEMAYSLYLLHGIVLYVMFNLVFAKDRVEVLSSMQYWALVVSLTPIIIGICALSTRYVEKPAMRSTARLVNYLRARHKTTRNQMDQQGDTQP